MARFDIFSSAGVVRYTGAPTYNGIFGKASYLEFQEIASPVPIAWEVGDYVDYTRTGLRYKLYSIPQPERRARSGASGQAVVYRNVQFFAATKDLEICPFNDLVVADNLIHYSSQPDVNTFENVQGIADRIQANLDAFYGSGLWSIRLYSSDSEVNAIMAEAKEFSVSDGNCMSALDAIYSTWKGIGWIHTYESGVNVITIGRPNVQDGDNSTDLFTYGRGNGLTVLATSLSGQNELATRIYPFGSTRNMISRYYNSKTTIKDYESVYIPNLMLPIASWGQTDSKYDPRKAYLENASAVAAYGLRVKRIYFDGSGDYEDIYPSIGGVTAKNIRDAKSAVSDSTYVPNSTRYPNAERMDLLKSVTNPVDNGIIGDGGKKYVETVTGASSTSGNTTTMLTRMGASWTSGIRGTAQNVPAGKLTVKSNLSASVTMPKNANPEVAFTAEVYCNGNIVQSKPVTPDVMVVPPALTDKAFTFNFPEITFSLTSGGEVYVCVKAEMGGDSGTNAAIAWNAAAYQYEVQNDFKDTFTVTLKQIGFDISKQQSSISDGLCTLNMKSGKCAGRDFVVKSVAYNSSTDDWTVVCYRQQDSSLGQYFPNTIYPMAAGDQFVLTDLEMPEIYINIAAARLADAATELLAKLSAPKVIYEPEVDAKVIAEYGDVLKEGMYMAVGDAELIGASPVYVLIDTLTIYENEANIPTYKVSLRDERYENTISKLTGEISRLNAQRRASLYDDARSRYLDDTAGETPGDPGVTILAEGNVFNYADESTVNPTSIQLLANAVNIPSPLYQWQYYNGSTWSDITSATSNQLTVLPNNGQYFSNDALVANIRCRVQDGSSFYYSDSFAITKIVGGEGQPGQNGMTSVVVSIYRRSATSDPATPSSDVSYNIATGQITSGSLGDWQLTIPATGDDPCYVSTYLIYTDDPSTTVFTLDHQNWTAPKMMAKNGIDGQDGSDGQDGNPGPAGQDAYVLNVSPNPLLIPTNDSLVIAPSTPRPTAQALLQAGASPVTSGVTYSLDSTNVIYFNHVVYRYYGTTSEYHSNIRYTSVYKDAAGNTLLLSQNNSWIWVNNGSRTDFLRENLNANVTINSSTGLITVGGNFSFIDRADVIEIPVFASVVVDNVTETISTVLTIAAQKQGTGGSSGRGISGVTEYYLATSQSSGVTTSTQGWTTNVQTMTSTNKYLWNYEVISYTDNSTPTTTTPHIIGVYGDQGGAGRGIASITEYYLATSQSSGVTKNTSGWTTTVQSVDSVKKYLWNYEVIAYTDGSTPTETDPHIVGAYGQQGDPGDAGQSSYKSTVFVRMNGTPTKPSGGSYSEPHPNSQAGTNAAGYPVSWSATIPAGSEILWASTRLFVSGVGPLTQDSDWSLPRQMTDTETFDVEFAKMQPNDATPAAPNGSNQHGGSGTQIWFDPVLDSSQDFTTMYWKAERQCVNGVWGNWTILRIKGKDGTDGTDGTNGYGEQVVRLYCRPASDPSVSGFPAMWYKFSTDTLSQTQNGSAYAPSGWYRTPPADNGNKLYMTAAVVRSNQDSVQIPANAWTSPVVDASNSALVTIYYQAEANVLGGPSKPSQNLTYNFKTGALTPAGYLNGWSVSLPTYNASKPVIWVSQALALSNTDTDIIKSSEWSSPTRLFRDGNDGTSPYLVIADKPVVSVPATSSGVIIAQPPYVANIQCKMMNGSTELYGVTWSLVNDYITFNNSKYYNAGITSRPSDYGLSPNSPYVYLWKSSLGYIVLTSTATPSQGDGLWDTFEMEYSTVGAYYKLVTGISINSYGRITGTVTGIDGDAAEILVMAKYGNYEAYTYITFEKNKQGDRGLAGKVMRGVNVYSSSNSFDYQGMDDTETGHIYYDVVSYTSNGTTKLYYCKIYKKGNTYAKAITPGTDSDVWVEAINFDFIATDLLFAPNAYIEYITNKGFYLKDGSGGNVTGGAQGDGNVIFWAGGSNPATAPFQVWPDGTVIATSGVFSGRLQMPFVEISADKTLSTTASSNTVNASSILIKAKDSTSGGHILSLPNSTDFNGWVLNVYVEPISTRMYSCGEIAGRILVPEKATPSNLQYFASTISPEYGGFFQFTCVSGQWVLISYNAASVTFVQSSV